MSSQSIPPKQIVLKPLKLISILKQYLKNHNVESQQFPKTTTLISLIPWIKGW